MVIPLKRLHRVILLRVKGCPVILERNRHCLNTLDVHLSANGKGLQNNIVDACTVEVRLILQLHTGDLVRAEHLSTLPKLIVAGVRTNWELLKVISDSRTYPVERIGGNIGLVAQLDLISELLGVSGVCPDIRTRRHSTTGILPGTFPDDTSTSLRHF